MKKVDIIFALSIISLAELTITEKMPYTLTLWILYGIFKFWNHYKDAQ